MRDLYSTTVEEAARLARDADAGYEPDGPTAADEADRPVRRQTLCVCGHDLGAHPPEAARPFAWPCVCCDCAAFEDLVRPEDFAPASGTQTGEVTF